MSQGALVTIAAPSITGGVKIGDSVSVNGVCLTATRVGSGFFVCDVSAETLRVSNFKQAKAVNLERSLMIGDRLMGTSFLTR